MKKQRMPRSFGLWHSSLYLNLASPRETEGRALGFHEEVGQLEKKRLEEALIRSRGNIHQAARDIDITYRIFYYKMKKYGIDYRRYLAR